MVTWATIELIAEWIIRIVMLVYVPNQRSPAAARTWLLLIFFLPWVGLVLYSLIGSLRVPRERLLRQRAVDMSVRDAVKRGTHLPVVPLTDLSVQQRGIADLAERLGGYPVVRDNRVVFLSDYAGALEQLIADIDTARHHVHLLTYIFRPDATGDRVSDALIRARARGVTCRVLLDAYGAKPGLQAYRKRWTASGVHVRALNPVDPLQRNVARFDIRNHRKITIIDGALAHCGSQNVLDATASLALPNEELVARVSGPMAHELQGVFCGDWYAETGENIVTEQHFPDWPLGGDCVAQILPSSPGLWQDAIQRVLITLLYRAEHQVTITTPYFVPDDLTAQSIRNAALRGVRVRLIVPEANNHPVVKWAQESFYEELIAAGVEVLRYQPAFLHAKVVTMDDALALMGSSNVDVRSFAINAEVMGLFYDRPTVTLLTAIQERYVAQSRPLDHDQWRNRPIARRLSQNIARLANTLL